MCEWTFPALPGCALLPFHVSVNPAVSACWCASCSSMRGERFPALAVLIQTALLKGSADSKADRMDDAKLILLRPSCLLGAWGISRKQRIVKANPLQEPQDPKLQPCFC